MKEKSKKLLISCSITAGILILWEILSLTGIFSAYVFPSPVKVWHAFLVMAKNGEIFIHLFRSIVRVIIGFLISFVLAFLLAIPAALYPKADPFYRHVFEFLRHIPPMSLIPLLILWFGIGEVPKITVIVLTAFFPIFMNTEAGFLGCDPKLLEVGETLHMSAKDIFFHIRIPAALPDILVGMQIGLGYSWRAIVGAEMIAAASGLGYLILDAQALSRTDKMLVGIIMIGIFGLLTDKLFGLAVKTVNDRVKMC